MAKFDTPFTGAPQPPPARPGFDWRWIEKPPPRADLVPGGQSPRAPADYDHIPADTFRAPDGAGALSSGDDNAGC